MSGNLIFDNIKTPEGTRLISGVFKIVDTHGIPLSVAIQELKDKGFMVNWINFYNEAIEHGWTEKRTYSTMVSAVEESYEKEWFENWKIKFDSFASSL